MTKSIKKIATIVMAAVIVLTAFAPLEAQAASKKKAAYPAVTASNTKVAKKSAKAYNMNITAGRKATLVVKVSGKNVTKKAKYVSNKKSVAAVNKNGVVTAKKAGTAEIRVTYKGKVSTLTVKVAKDTQPVVTASNAKVAEKSAKAYSMNITAGNKAKLVVKVSGKNVTKKAKYESTKKSVATVNKNGVVTAKKAGTAKIKVTYKGKTSTLTVKVAKKAENNKPADTPKAEQPGHVHTDACYGTIHVCTCGKKFTNGTKLSEHRADIALKVDLGLIDDDANNHSSTSVKVPICGY